ncbi:hypothetical protein CEUSTIGMA_g2151.t1 [Chlamydomonas eustigma]|uniref:NOL1/NOP2/Sun domain family member 4 n=1 Tax=Chlamydomonas eustigma TaxID=1157962 RepID=A0A250WV39_9CHLO|nr:hypothetical protein CEUSTIGMA_g2151.t1 [Chlamydomonas eustigma]|eukprot:GAX74703.1 hypothetical protein CEUSTIGMA_g2151.t1 [Chlamydomonas eustigma]
MKKLNRKVTNTAFSDSSKEFEACFTEVYGTTRWKILKKSLLHPAELVAFQNHFSCISLADEATLLPWFASGTCISAYKRVEATPDASYPPPWCSPLNGLKAFYWLDAASLLPAILLDVQPGMSTLDMCASPGGKSLVLAHQTWRPDSNIYDQTHLGPRHVSSVNAKLQGHIGGDSKSHSLADDPKPEILKESLSSEPGAAISSTTTGERPLQLGSLTCNEPDTKRRQRLQQVLNEYLPPILAAQVRIVGQEGDKYWARNECDTYDRVLIDAPCSSDRHVMQQSLSNRGMIPSTQWTLQGCKKIADLQLQLLLSGLRCAKVGGLVVFSTCSMLPLENDKVVDRLLSRVGANAVEVIAPGHQSFCLHDTDLDRFGTERTKYGLLSLPDLAGWGPIYTVVIRKVGSIAKAFMGGSLGLLQPVVTSSSDEEDEQESQACE